MSTQTKRGRTVRVSKSQEKEVCELSIGEWVATPELQVQETLAQARLAGKVAMREANKAQENLDGLSNAILIYDNSDNDKVKSAALKIAGASSIEELRAEEKKALASVSSASASKESIDLRNSINEDLNNACARFFAFLLPITSKVGLTHTRALRLCLRSVRVNPEALLGYDPVRVDWVAYAREDVAERKPRGNWLEASIPAASLPHKKYSVVINRTSGKRAMLCDKKLVGRKYRLHFVYEGKDVLSFADRSNKQIANDWVCREVEVWADKSWTNKYRSVVNDMIGKGLSDVAEGMLHQSIALPQLLETLSGNTRPIVSDTAKPANADANSALKKEAVAVNA